MCPQNLLKAALLERAKEDISRIHQLKKAQISAEKLLEKRSISMCTMGILDKAERELIAELDDVVKEAKGLGGEEWGETILAQANEYYLKNTLYNAIERGKRYAEHQYRKSRDETRLKETKESSAEKDELDLDVR
jgi:translocation protein SEC66